MAFVRRVRWSFFPLLSKALQQNGIDTKNHLFTRSPLRVNERTEGRQQRYEENERVRRAREGIFQGEATKDIAPWLKANLNRQGCGRDVGQIRMAGGDGEGTPGKQKKFKGFAFVDFTTAKAAKKALKLHDTLFRGRPVTVERCERKTYQEPKSVRRAKKEEGKEVNTKEEGKTKREGLKVLTAPDDVEVVIKHACENSEGTLRESDFDDRLKSFLGLLPRDVCEKAANEIRKFTTNKNKKEVKNKGAFYMGIVRKISNACWQKKAAKDSMEEKIE